MNMDKKSTYYWKNVYDYKKTIGIDWRIKYISDLVKNNENKISSVLELGCNSGQNLLEIGKNCKNISLTGIELNPDAVEYGRGADGNTTNFIVGGVDELDKINNHSFDLVLSSGVLIYFSPNEILSILKNLIRVSKKYILHIERYEKKSYIYKVIHKHNLHMYDHNFISYYKNIGIGNVRVKCLKEKFPKLKNTKDLIVVELTDDKFEII